METMPEPDALCVLGRLLVDPLVVVDVGARWGVAPVWRRFGDRCRAIGFEPDAVECERLNQRGDAMRFYPVALGARTGLATLHLTTDRKGCSLYPPSPELIARHPGCADSSLESTTMIELSALDDWCAAEGIDRVDAMKIDVQGAELDVLQGAARTLQAVRVVEVEVEFNELYQGVPLFGDVDRFLREQGFVLWRLHDLAHYAQAGVRSEWRTMDATHFDTVTSVFPAGAGQLFWANAVYVKRDVAYPEAEAGWVRLVRDACMTGAHELLDLSGLALELAKKTAPESVVAEIEVAQSAALLAARQARELTERSSALSSAIKRDFADPEFAGGGWYSTQVLDFGSVRWSGPGRDAWVDFPLTLLPGTRIEFLAVGFITPDIAANLTVRVNGVVVEMRSSPHQHGSLYAGVMPSTYRSERLFTRVMISTPPPVPWNVVNPESADDTELGLAVSWMRLTPPDDAG